MYAAMRNVVGGDFLVEVKLCPRGRIIGFLQYCYRCIIAIAMLSERVVGDLIEKSFLP